MDIISIKDAAVAKKALGQKDLLSTLHYLGIDDDRVRHYQSRLSFVKPKSGSDLFI